MFDGILFDLDGTLWDATPTMVEVWDQLLAERPNIVRPPVTQAEIRANMGRLLDDIALRMFPQQDEEERRDIMEQFCTTEEELLARQGGELFPLEEEVLARLAGQSPLFIVSNCQDGYIESFYRGNGLGRFFSGEESAGRTGLPKSENIKLVAARHGLKNPVYIGDTVLDRDAAAAAGIPFLHAAYGFGKVDCVHFVQSFAEIPTALEHMSPP